MATAENDQELRLALAMRGGASMAVWIGGAVAEINRLRAATTESGGAHPWAELARLAGYDAVTVDVLAGASAGGLNATLLSATLVYGMPFDPMRRTWVRLADLEAMSRPVPRFWQPGPPSLLEGDDYFRAELARTITESVPRGAGPDGRADLLLTATLLDPIVEQHLDARSGPMLLERRNASFRFRHQGRAGDPLSDFGAGEDFGATVLRLAHAARATSSFPFAFEPAQVHSAPGEPPGGEPNMVGLFSETTAEPKPFRVIDGGVLDNIPVTAAINAISAVPADRPTNRWLLYLNPDPVASHGQRREPGRAVPVTLSALGARQSQESLLADLDALDEHNAAAERNALRRRALFAPLRAVAEQERPTLLARHTAAIEPEHAVVRAELDAQAVYQLLTEPAGTEDGTLLPPVIGDPLREWSAAARTQLAHRLATVLRNAADATLFDDTRSLLAGIQECLGWAWDIERWADQPRDIGTAKSALYRLRQFGEVLAGHADRYWINGARLEPIVEAAELDAWIQRILACRDRIQHHLPTPIEPLLGAVLEAVADGEGFQQALAEFAAELRSMVESSGADEAPEDNGVDAVAAARTVLRGITDRLAAAAPSREQFDQPEQLGYALLEQAADRAEVLRRLVVLTAPLDAGRVPGSRINLLRVVSDEPSPLPFAALRRGNAPLRIEDKIRGLDLGAFGAFLSAKWRANDWMWGRMDAVAGLVRLLADPARLVTRHEGSEQLGDALQAIVSRPTTAELGDLDEQQARAWRGFLAELWARHAGEVRAELDALFAEPDGEHPLPETRELLTERLQWTVAAEEIPFVAKVSMGAEPDGGEGAEVPAPDELTRSVENYSVGTQRLSDLGERRTLSIATRAALLGYRAARPRGPGALLWLARRAMTVLKPLLIVVAFAFAAPRRAAILGFIAATAAAFTAGSVSFEDTPQGFQQPVHTQADMVAVAVGDGSGAPASPWTLFDFLGITLSPGVILTMLVVAVFAVWTGRGLTSRLGSGLARWLPALAIAAVLLAAVFGLVTTGFRLGPLGLIAIATLLTWPATVAYRTTARIVATILTPVVFLAVLWLNITDAWVAVATLASAYAHMILLGTIDTLPPRPRPTPNTSS